jgi:very-short-patch-repair endonuclease
MCKELMLIIEVDGITHQFDEVIRKDQRKQAMLEAAGFTAIRFSDDEVLTNMKRVVEHLKDWIETREKKTGKGNTKPRASTRANCPQTN